MTDMIETRHAYGEALLELGARTTGDRRARRGSLQVDAHGALPRCLPESILRYRHRRGGHGQHGRGDGGFRA